MVQKEGEDGLPLASPIVLVAPDKFKGSLSAREVCEAVEAGVLRSLPQARVQKVPLADGGDGSLDILEEVLGLERISLEVLDPLFRPIQAHFGLRGEEAYVELALASGLPLLQASERHTLRTTTYGTGQLIREALGRGAKQVYLLVGGSATTDGGMGLAAGMGFQFRDRAGKTLRPMGANLGRIASVISPGESWGEVEFILVTDVQNQLLGPNGAAYQYGPQKGATLEELAVLEAGMTHFAQLTQQRTGIPVKNIPGSGAAGGVALVVCGWLGGTIRPGIDSLLQEVGFADMLATADLVITGEGKMDAQTLQGKVVHGVARAASATGVPVWAVCGRNDLSPEEIQSLGLAAVSCLSRADLSAEYCMNHAAVLLEERTVELLLYRWV